MSTTETDIIHTPDEYETEFDPHAYLEHFYSPKAVNCGTKVALFALPRFLKRIASCYPNERFDKLLDVGAGPTIYSALCARNYANEVCVCVNE
jgi:hypothetical protein